MKQYGVVAQNSDLEPVAQSRIVANGYTGALGVASVCGLSQTLFWIAESRDAPLNDKARVVAS